MSRRIRGDKIADDLASLGAEQPIVGPEPAVEISDAQINKYFALWEDVNNKEVWMKKKAADKPRPLSRGPVHRIR